MQPPGQRRFLVALSIVSIFGFLGIFAKTIANKNIDMHIEAAWLLIVGLAILTEVNFDAIHSIPDEGLNKTNFTNLVTLILGTLAMISGILSFPTIRLESPGFLAIKGILAIIVITAIAIQTWVLEDN